jgi:hypothetical protein
MSSTTAKVLGSTSLQTAQSQSEAIGEGDAREFLIPPLKVRSRSPETSPCRRLVANGVGCVRP